MLHIKLPKGKVAQACGRLATMLERKAEAEVIQYEALVESWRKSQARLRETGSSWVVVLPPPYADFSLSASKQMRDMQTSCMASTGDVYVSHELWNQIKGYYDG